MRWVVWTVTRILLSSPSTKYTQFNKPLPLSEYRYRWANACASSYGCVYKIKVPVRKRGEEGQSISKADHSTEEVLLGRILQPEPEVINELF